MNYEDKMMMEAMFAETDRERVLVLLRLIRHQEREIEFLANLVNWDDEDDAI